MDRILMEINKIDPNVGTILASAKNERSKERSINKDQLYNLYKREVEKHVGIFCPNPILQSPLYYQVVMRALCDALEY